MSNSLVYLLVQNGDVEVAAAMASPPHLFFRLPRTTHYMKFLGITTCSSLVYVRDCRDIKIVACYVKGSRI